METEQIEKQRIKTRWEEKAERQERKMKDMEGYVEYLIWGRR